MIFFIPWPPRHSKQVHSWTPSRRKGPSIKTKEYRREKKIAVGLLPSPFLFFFLFSSSTSASSDFFGNRSNGGGHPRLRALYFTPIHSNWGKYRGIVSRKLTVATVAFLCKTLGLLRRGVFDIAWTWDREGKIGGRLKSSVTTTCIRIPIARSSNQNRSISSRAYNFMYIFKRKFYELERILYLFTLCFSISFTLWETRGVKIRPVVYLGSLQSASTAQYPMQIRG